MHLVVDGYNVMHALPVGQEWPGRSFKERRNVFLDRLNAYTGERAHRVTVVFDGAKGGDEMGGSETHGGIQVLYTARGIEADQVIRELVERASPPGEILLVSSDKSVSGYVRSLGASTARADELVRRLQPVSPPGRSVAEDFETQVKGCIQNPRRSRLAKPHPKERLQLW